MISEKYTCIFSLVDRRIEIMLTKDFIDLRKKKAEKDNEAKKYDMH